MKQITFAVTLEVCLLFPLLEFLCHYLHYIVLQIQRLVLVPCPTFYALRNGQWVLMSEGFSSSISPSFEKKDIDMLYWVDEVKNELSLKLTNEALETHVIRYVDLLAFPESEGERVFATENGQFYRTSGIISPISCEAEDGDCLNLIEKMDRNERFCGTDTKNLSRKEEIILSFDNDSQSELGFLIGSRQTLLTTHLFYQVMAYTGKSLRISCC